MIYLNILGMGCRDIKILQVLHVFADKGFQTLESKRIVGKIAGKILTADMCDAGNRAQIEMHERVAFVRQIWDIAVVDLLRAGKHEDRDPVKTELSSWKHI